jgi:hypothetical protein
MKTLLKLIFKKRGNYLRLFLKAIAILKYQVGFLFLTNS